MDWTKTSASAALFADGFPDILQLMFACRYFVKNYVPWDQSNESYQLSQKPFDIGANQF